MAVPLSLADTPVGASVRVADIMVSGVDRRRLLDLGLVPEAVVKSIRNSPAGNPRAYLVKGTVIALRNEDAAQILVKAY